MLLAIASILLGIILLWILLRIGRIDLRLSIRQIRAVSLVAFTKLVLLNILLILISTEKWRRVDTALRTSGDTIPSRTAAFGMTSIGMALGLIMPVQLGMAAARTFGTHFYGRPLQRGTAGTFFEQSFDLIVVFFLSIASLITWIWRGHESMWTSFAVLMFLVALLAVGPAMRFMRWFAGFGANMLSTGNRLKTSLIKLSELESTGVLSEKLGRQLLTLSVLRFSVVVLMAWQTAEAVSAPIALWQMAAMVPFTVPAMALALTPGAIGLSELASVTALTMFGSSLSVAAQWSIANRILATASCFFIAGPAALALLLQRIFVTSRLGRNRSKEFESL